MNKNDKQVVDAAKEFGASDLTQDLVRIIERLQHGNNKLELELARAMASDIKSTTECLVYMRENSPLKTQLQKMQALLERWMTISQLYMGAKLNQVAEDTKTLLKEAKEVKDE